MGNYNSFEESLWRNMKTKTGKLLIMNTMALLLFVMVGCLPFASKTLYETKKITETFPAFSLSLTPTQTRTPRPTLTPLPTSTVTLTALPTMSVSETEDFLLGLYNNNCSLPCWGGFIPGEIKWLEVKQKLEAASLKVDTFKGGGGASFEIPRLGIKSSIEFYTFRGSVYMIRPIIQSRSFDLQPFLKKYGEPDEVWIRTFSATSEGYLPFRIFLFYNRGIFVLYEYLAKMIGEELVICPAAQIPESKPFLYVWGSDSFGDIASVIKGTGELGDEEKFIRKLEDVTNLTLDLFYKEAILQQTTFCIKTSRALW